MRNQAGFSLVEVMVTALIVALASTATVASIGQSQKTSARTLGRGVAATLAEQDQERMRAMRATDLADYTFTQTVTRQTASYRIDSTSEFVQDANGGAVSCTSTGSQSQFMRLTSTVTPLTSTKADPPLTLQSLYALPITQYSPTSGTLIVQIFKADGITGQQGVPVSLTGPESRTATTNSKGCAVFQFLATGAYTANVNKTGYVNQSLLQNVNLSGTVTAATINQTTPLLYDVAGKIDYLFDTNGSLQALHSKGVTVANSGIPSPGLKTYPGTATADGLFPFTGPYTAYSGTCTFNDPSKYDTNYFTTTHPTYGRQIVTAGTAYTGATAVRLREPAIKTAITLDGVATSNLATTVKETDTGCVQTYPATTTSTGALSTVGYPYGTYAVCTEYNRTTGTAAQKGLYFGMKTGIANTDFAGTPATGNHTININTSSTATTVSGNPSTGHNSCANVLP